MKQRRVAGIAERPAYGRDGLVEVIVLDDRLRPDSLEQLLLADHPVAVLDEVHKHVVSTPGERYRRAVRADEPALGELKTEVGKPVTGQRGVHGNACGNLQISYCCTRVDGGRNTLCFSMNPAIAATSSASIPLNKW